MTCSDIQCIPGDHDFTLRLKGKTLSDAGAAVAGAKAASAEQVQADSAEQSVTGLDGSPGIDTTGNSVPAAIQEDASGTSDESTRSATLWGVFFLSMLAGLGGLLTPCVYPMIPMTVSFFLRGNKSRGRAISEALVFGFSIIFLYTLIGVLVAVFKNPNAVNNFTTHWITNLIFFLIFIILSASFFGMFEIMLPSGLANSVDRKADKGGYAGAFFMALAMAILSFSCTGPIIASLLIKASQGQVLEPVIGMAGFSIVFALPFTLFAIFPSWLKGLPKSGGWLNTIKVFFAFIMLAFSVYFLGKIDQSYHLNLLSRSLFIGIWTVVFTLLGLYLLGKIKFAHDSDMSFIGVPRFFMAIASFSFALYLATGLLGNELRSLSSILPPADSGIATRSEQKYEPVDAASHYGSALCSFPRYASFLSLPHNLQGYFDYEEALACARELGKPVLVDFVGHTCSNCKKMYSEVWSDPEVLRIIQREFIVVALYTDDKTKLPEQEWITSASDGKVKNTLGKKNQDLQVTRFGSNALPLYAIVDGEGNDILSKRYTYNPDIQKFLDWLNEGLKSPAKDISIISD
jgi:thiol:disulfide interchange protein DsbD